MRRLSILFGLIGGGAALLGAVTSACSGNNGGSGFGSGNPGGQDQDGSAGSFDDGGVPTIGTLGDGGRSSGDGGTACPSGLSCNVACPGGTTTTISGKVYDPAGKNPLYNVAVYVPAVPLVTLPKGVPTGADACSCDALFKSGAVVNTSTAVDGTFKLTNAPVGNVSLVLQVGKWRKVVSITTKACQDNAQPDRSLALPSVVAPGTEDNIPDIAVSTGSADTLECLLKRIGLPDSEYVAGAAGTGHIHVFAGGGSGGGGGGGGTRPGKPEIPGMAGAPSSPTSLWSTEAQLMPYDIVLLSCEGGETYNANPQALESYLNAGGRAFGSHFHYAFFSGPIGTTQSYTAPADWGTQLATWTTDQNGGTDPMGGTVVQTLNNGSGPFAKGQALAQWLALNGALGAGILVPSDLPISQPRYNASVSAANTPSQPWISSDPSAGGVSGETMYFSFDTPVNAPKAPDGGAPNYCGRAVFSDLHVAGAMPDIPAPPAGCNGGDLSAQEKALEFMLFDLSSCVLPDYIAPPDGGPIIR